MPPPNKEILFDRLFGSIRECCLLVDLDGLIQSTNPAATTILGFSTSELQGRSLESLVFVEDRLQAMSELAPVIQGIAMAAFQQVRMNCKFGRTEGCYVNGYPIHVAGVVAGLLVLIWPLEEYQEDKLLISIQARLKELERQIERECCDAGIPNMNIHVGDNTGHDKVGRDKNSMRTIITICGVLTAIVGMLAYAAYVFTFAVHKGGATPPSIERQVDDARP